jgi:hypothetical protein
MHTRIKAPNTHSSGEMVNIALERLEERRKKGQKLHIKKMSR